MIVTGHLFKVIARPKGNTDQEGATVMYVITNGVNAGLQVAQEAASAKGLDVVGILDETEVSVDGKLLMTGTSMLN